MITFLSTPFFFQFCTTVFKERKSEKEANVPSSTEHTPCSSRRITAATTSPTISGNLLTASWTVESARLEVAARILPEKEEDLFDVLADSPIQEERLAVRTQLPQYVPSYYLEDALREQIASMPLRVEDATVYLFNYAEQATESSPYTKVLAVIHPIVNRSVRKSIQYSVFQSTIDRAVQVCLIDHYVENKVATYTICSLTDTGPKDQ